MLDTERLVVLKAIELMSYGIDISSFKTVDDYKKYVRADNNTLISRLSPNVKDFIIECNDDAESLLEIWAPFVIRQGKSFLCVSPEFDDENLLKDKKPNIKIDRDIVMNTIRTLYKLGVCTFNSFDPEELDEEFAKKIKAIEDSFDVKAVPDTPMIKKLTKEATRRNFGIITSLAYQKAPEVKELMLQAYEKVYNSFNINTLKDFKVIDNRLYIPLSEADRYYIKKWMKRNGYTYESMYDELAYIVVSKNLYDYYFCSYGSEFQSCYSLTSEHHGYFGMLPYGTFDSHYIIYGAKADVAKTAILADNNKWMQPYMFFRCWGWTSTNDELLVDKVYTSRGNFYKAVVDVVMKKYMKVFEDSAYIPTKEGAEMSAFFNKYRLRFYADSVKTSMDFSFRMGQGDRCFVGDSATWSHLGRSLWHSWCQKVTSVKDSFDPRKSPTIVNGVLINPKICPMTKLLIDDTESVSKYAKYLNSPIEHDMCVVTYCDGMFKLDATTKGTSVSTEQPIYVFPDETNSGGTMESRYISFTPQFSKDNKSLKTFKEFIKGNVNKSIFDLILLRVIEDDKVIYIKYKKQGVKA